MKVLVIDQDINCLSDAEIKGSTLGIQIDKLQLPRELPPALEQIKHLAEEFGLLFYKMYLAGIVEKYDYVLLDFQWIDALRDGHCRYCHGAFNALEKMQLVKHLLLIHCDGFEKPTFGEVLQKIAGSQLTVV